MRNVRERYRVAYNEAANKFVVHKPSGKVTFVQSPEGLHYHDVGGPRTRTTSSMETIKVEAVGCAHAHPACADSMSEYQGIQ